jgi:hypothetical protein
MSRNGIKGLVPFALTWAFTAMITGCGGDLGALDQEEAEETVENDQLALEASNALVPNALVPNALVPNALVPNALVPNALVPNALTPSAIAALSDPGAAGQSSRSFLRYAVGCAFAPGEKFAFSWTDAGGVEHDEMFAGELGLAPEWANRALNETEQHWVSACLAARTNWYGIQVVLSIRGAHEQISAPSAKELTSYPMEEGAFWGNLFAEQPYLRACYAAANTKHSRAHLRECAAGHVEGQSLEECGIIEIVGSCEDLCDPIAGEGQYHSRCVDDPALPSSQKTDKLVTVFLP